MLNMLVVIENKNLGIKLINKISETNRNIRLYNYINDEKECIKILNDRNIDFIILEVNFETSFGIEVLESIKNKEEFYNSVIVISNNNSQNYPCVFEYLKKPIKLNKLYNCIGNIYNYKELNNIALVTKNKITDFLLYLGYEISYIGTKYLIEAIFEIYYKKDYLGDNLKNNIYNVLAHKYKKSVNTIYGDIKQATKRMHENCNQTIIKDFFNLDEFRKLKVTEIIFTIINKLK